MANDALGRPAEQEAALTNREETKTTLSKPQRKSKGKPKTKAAPKPRRVPGIVPGRSIWRRIWRAIWIAILSLAAWLKISEAYGKARESVVPLLEWFSHIGDWLVKTWEALERLFRGGSG